MSEFYKRGIHFVDDKHCKLAIEVLEQENKKLRDTVEFYADTNNWHLSAINTCDQDHVIGGLLARKVLKELGDE